MSLTHNHRLKRLHGVAGGTIQYSAPGHKKMIKIPSYQFGVSLGYDNFYLVPCNPLSTTAISSNSKILFDIDESIVPQQFGDPFFMFDITCSTASVTCLPLPYICERYRLLQLPDVEIARWYPANIISFIHMTTDKEEFKFWQQMMGFHLSDEAGGLSQKLSSNLVFNTNDVNKLLFLPIPSGFCHMGGFDMEHLKKLRFELQIDNTDFVTSGSSANLTLNNLYLVFPTKELESFDRQLTLNSEKESPHVFQYLDFDYIPFNSQALNASTDVSFVLDQFNHKSAFLLVHVLGASGSPSGTQLINTYDVGDLGRFDILSETNKSIYAQSSPLYEAQVYQQFTSMIEKLCMRGWYYIPFTSNLKRAWNGSLDEGFFQFPGSKLKLQISFPADSTQEVTTFTLTNSANDGGFYQFFASNKINGETDISNNLAHNANAATMETAITGLNPIANLGYTPTASAAATATFTVTWSKRDGRVSDTVKLGIITDSLNDAGTYENASVATTTYGKRGWTTIANGSNQIVVYSYYFKKCTIDERGQVKIENL